MSTCTGTKQDGKPCTNDARDDHDTCGHHDPEKVAARRAARAAKVAAAEDEKQSEAQRPVKMGDDQYPDPSGEDPAVALAAFNKEAVKWLGEAYDLGSSHAVMAAAAASRLGGVPAWLLIVSGSGNTKTATVQTLIGAGAYVESSISGEAALLSGTGKKDRAKDATGGLLMRIGPQGILVLKDVTTILSMSGEARLQVLAALREIYDGQWGRNVGTDGGFTISWSGHLTVVGAVTSKWDNAHSTISSCGDRFLLYRTDSADKKGRRIAGRQAMDNVGSEAEMNAALAEAVRRVVRAASRDEDIALTDAEAEQILDAADFVTMARTNVEVDRNGAPMSADAPEAPTRMAKQLAQIARGGIAIGMTREDAMSLALRCAHDSIPPNRRIVMRDLATHADHVEKDDNDADVFEEGFAFTTTVSKRTGLPYTTADRELMKLRMLGLLEVAYIEGMYKGESKTRWAYAMSAGTGYEKVLR